MSDKKIKLKPCPDCNGQAEVRQIADSYDCKIVFVVGCSNSCNTDKNYSSPCTHWHDTPRKASEAWNNGEHYKIRYLSFAGGRWTGD